MQETLVKTFDLVPRRKERSLHLQSIPGDQLQPGALIRVAGYLQPQPGPSGAQAHAAAAAPQPEPQPGPSGAQAAAPLQLPEARCQNGWTGVQFTVKRKTCKFCPKDKTNTFKCQCSSSKCNHQNVCLPHSKLICKYCWETTDHGFE